MSDVDRMIMDAARELLARLHDVVGDAAAELEPALAALIARADAGENVALQILILVRPYPAARRWIARAAEADGVELRDGGEKSLAPRAIAPQPDLDADRDGKPGSVDAHVAYGLLRAPAEVLAREPFLLEVGLAQDPPAGVAGPPLRLPRVEIESYAVDVRIAAPGFAFPVGEAQRFALEVSARDPFPVRRVHLVPRRPAGGSVDRRITAEFAIRGERLGDAIRWVRVLSRSDLRPPLRVERIETGVNVLAPTGAEKADVTLTVRASDRPGRVSWTLESPHTDVVTPNERPFTVDIGKADEFLRDLIEQIDGAEGSEGVYGDVLALATRIGQKIPGGVWTAIRAVAAKTRQPPTILLVSEDPHVPWELARVDPPLVAGSKLPPFLAAQARIGRWVQATEVLDGQARPSPNPPRRKNVVSLGVVWGSYARTSWTNLVHASVEARELARLYGAEAIRPTGRAMYDLLLGRPAPDLLHFAVHGRYNPQNPGGESGIILTDGSSLHANEIAARSLAARPVVFLNACQLGAGQTELGTYSGVAAAFVEAGASAVVAPLWKVDDKIARQVALAFYQQVAAGTPLSEVLRKAREPFVDAYETRSATWMAYQLFGHPSFIITGLKTG